jgi:phytoene synthase
VSAADGHVQPSTRFDHEATMRQCRETLAQNSKTFAMAARLLPAASRDRAASLYAYCRRVDDAIDDCPPEQQPLALQALKAELSDVYRGTEHDLPVLAAFHAVVETTRLPARYPNELLEGMAKRATSSCSTATAWRAWWGS